MPVSEQRYAISCWSVAICRGVGLPPSKFPIRQIPMPCSLKKLLGRRVPKYVPASAPVCAPVLCDFQRGPTNTSPSGYPMPLPITR